MSMYDSFCFDEIFNSFGHTFAWKFDAEKEELVIDVPGYSKEDIEVFVDNKILTVKINKNKEQKYVFGNFYQIKNAECKNGQLKIKFEKIENKGQKIEVM